MTGPLRIGSRGSALALAQSRWVAARLHEITGVEPVIEIVKTSGDRVQDVALRTFGGVGVFTKEIDEGQRAGRFEISVHSLKDLPTAGREGLVLVATPERAPVEDTLVTSGGRMLADLPHGARVGSGSPRRRAQLLRLRPDLVIEEIRGNVDTRIRKVRDGTFDATMLARAGLVRLGLTAEISEVLAPDRFVPAAGQGSLALVVGDDGSPRAAAAIAAVAQLDHAPTRAEIAAERAVLCTLGGGCHLPLGCLARVSGGRVTLHARVVSIDGREMVEASGDDTIDHAEALGLRIGAELVAKGARALLPKE
ncbi:MAG: hydroxymethylbilane synthase [Planctomycetes bacterium]|nr:hydroxymethylbilane synthase [Planctomycetota bacterium]